LSCAGAPGRFCEVESMRLAGASRDSVTLGVVPRPFSAPARAPALPLPPRGPGGYPDFVTAGLVVLIALAVVVFIVLARSIRIVPQARAGIVERLGRYQRTLNP